jgi:murein DD-endopeptidase MepM/ murein hydrolase activator NlpD
MRRGVCLLVLCVLGAACASASAQADGTTTTGTTTTTSAPSYARLAPSYLPAACVGAGAAAIAEPGQQVLELGAPASGRGPSAYPADASVVAFGSETGGGSTCKTAQVALDSVSLFGGLVQATSVSATNGRGTVSGLEIAGSAVTLTAGQTVPLGYWGQLTLGRTVDRLTAPLVVQLLQRHGSLPAGTTVAVGFAATAQPVEAKPKAKPKPKPAHHSARHSSSPPAARHRGGKHAAGTHRHGSHGQQAKKKHRPKKRAVPQPLTARPSLGYKPSHYVFPVDGGASYVDTYGANRNDIYDGWHHGDDLFSPLGTPVVAVTGGTLSLVGWNELGGWRLWLTDGKGNSFYYAHLAGYTHWILQHPKVHAGEVIGFLGRTGDAFTTTPHLHFEVHPHLYNRLGYDGAVDPTTYLHKWQVVHVPADEIPRPARLKAPVGTPTQEAAVVWHELLVARHLLHTPGSGTAGSGTASPASVRQPFPLPRMLDAAGESPLQIARVQPTAARVSESENMTPWPGGWLGGGVTGAAIVAALLGGALLTVRRRRRTASETPG